MNVLLWGGYKDEATEKLIYKTKNVLNRETDDLDSNIRHLAMREKWVGVTSCRMYKVVKYHNIIVMQHLAVNSYLAGNSTS